VNIGFGGKNNRNTATLSNQSGHCAQSFVDFLSTGPPGPACGIMFAMSPKLKRVLEAIFWFVLGHLSCAVMHHLHI
jgi:hypothetical protein